MAMRTIRGAKDVAMDACAKRSHDLSVHFPEHWGVIAVADNICRTEKWVRLRRQLEKDYRNGDRHRNFNPAKPWSSVIAYSSSSSWANVLA